MLEIKHLKTAQALNQAGSLAAAAHILHTTQSALSHQIKELEHRLGQPIFIRKSKPLQFTQVGELILKLATQTLPLIGKTERQLKQWSQGDGGRLHMAIECHSCFQWLFPALDDYRQQWPNVEVDFASGFHFDALDALTEGELDLVITADPVPSHQLTYIPLFSYQTLLLMSQHHPLKANTAIKPEDLAQQTLISYPVEPNRLSVYRDFLIPAGISPTENRQTELTQMMVQLVLSDRGVAALPEWVIAEYKEKAQVEAKPFTPELWSTLYAAIRTEQNQADYLQSFIETAKTSCFQRLENVRGDELVR